MIAEYSVEEVRNVARQLDGLSRQMLNAYANSIERVQDGVISNSTVAKARDAYNNALVGVSISQISAMRAALLSVWPSVPAQAAQVDFHECSGNPASCPENEGFGCCAEHAKPITLSTAALTENGNG